MTVAQVRQKGLELIPASRVQADDMVPEQAGATGEGEDVPQANPATSSSNILDFFQSSQDRRERQKKEEAERAAAADACASVDAPASAECLPVRRLDTHNTLEVLIDGKLPHEKKKHSGNALS